MSNLEATIADRLARLSERIAAAALRAGRRPEDVRLVAVTKFVPEAALRAVVAAGCVDLGESRPQELWSKAAALGELPIRWHLVGHLQRNKAARTVPLLALLHSLDSARLLRAVDEAAAPAAQPLPALVEVNVSGEAAKHGLPPEQVETLLAQLAGARHVRVAGLMGMAPLAGGAAAARAAFARLRALRERLRPLAPAGHALDELSMGMSGDFEAAIAEGATIVRIGSALFEST